MYLRIWRVTGASSRERERDMVDIVGGETLASLWDKLARKCGEKDFFIFQNLTDLG